MSGPTKTYEMLWDCKYCGARKLLGKSHRHCPNCGGPQDPTARYFPAEADKVAVEDHVYYGADVACGSCGFSNSKNANNCAGCGAPLSGAKEAARRGDQVAAYGGQFAGESVADARRELGGGPGYGPPRAPQAPAKKSSPVLWIVGGIVALLITTFLVAVFWTKQAALEVTGHAWQRSVAVEVLSEVRESSWCDATPSDARGVSRHREQRGTKDVPDGEECGTRRVDNGDGTFNEVPECKPRYRSEPVYDDKCDYTVERWRTSRTELARGGLADERRWPQVALKRPGACLGCEREGPREATYTLTLVSSEGDKAESTCDFDEERWASMEVGSIWTGEIGVMTGALDCDTLKAGP